MRLINIILISFIGVVFLGCSQKQLEKNPYIKSSQTLKQSPFDEQVRYFKTEDFDIRNYNRIYIDDIEIINNINNEKVDKKVLDNITSYFQVKLEKNLNEAIKTNIKNNSLLLKIAITNIDVAYEDLAFYQYLPYGLAFTAIKRGVGYEEKELNVQLVLKLIDTQTSKTLLLLVDNGLVKNILSHDKITFINTKPLLDAWINKYTLRVKELNEGKYNKK